MKLADNGLRRWRQWSPPAKRCERILNFTSKGGILVIQYFRICGDIACRKAEYWQFSSKPLTEAIVLALQHKLKMVPPETRQ
ncbi:hypothetical protein BBta_7155 [Bradyrhizobium sp. BTAi1]|nr:hypothetical protein BBta_7155 [Bradyrhizobium sp. BTAi1]